MKMFVTRIIGKTVMSNDGQVLGEIENVLVDTKTGALQSILITPSDEVKIENFKTDADGRILLPFEKFQAIRDVVVMKVD